MFATRVFLQSIRPLPMHWALVTSPKHSRRMTHKVFFLQFSLSHELTLLPLRRYSLFKVRDTSRMEVDIGCSSSCREHSAQFAAAISRTFDFPTLQDIASKHPWDNLKQSV